MSFTADSFAVKPIGPTLLQQAPALGCALVKVLAAVYVAHARVSESPMSKTFRNTQHTHTQLSPALRARCARPSLSSRLLLGACLCAALSGCEQRVTPTRQWQPADHGQPAQLDPSRLPAEAAEAATEEGGTERAADALYNVSCAGCHGRDGRGQGPASPPGAQPRDFTDPQFQAQRSDAQLAQVIREGRGLMPPFGKQVNEEGLQALVAKVRRFGPPPQQASSDRVGN